MKYPFVCAWYSPRGFANEGVYYYGSLDAWRQFVASVSDVQGDRYYVVSWHKYPHTAEIAANQQAKASSRRIAWGEQDYTYAASLGDELRIGHDNF